MASGDEHVATRVGQARRRLYFSFCSFFCPFSFPLLTVTCVQLDAGMTRKSAGSELNVRQHQEWLACRRVSNDGLFTVYLTDIAPCFHARKRPLEEKTWR